MYIKRDGIWIKQPKRDIAKTVRISIDDEAFIMAYDGKNFNDKLCRLLYDLREGLYDKKT